jgi:hypothetical protein
LENKDVLLQFVLRRMETNPWVDRAIIGAALTFIIVVVAGYTHDTIQEQERNAAGMRRNSTRRALRAHFEHRLEPSLNT